MASKVPRTSPATDDLIWEAVHKSSVGHDGDQASVRNTVYIQLFCSFRNVLKDLVGAPLAVFIDIALYMNYDSKSWPGLRAIARDTGYAINTVRAAIVQLEKIGFIATNKGQRGQTTVYSVNKWAHRGRLGSVSADATLAAPPRRRSVLTVSADATLPPSHDGKDDENGKCIKNDKKCINSSDTKEEEVEEGPIINNSTPAAADIPRQRSDETLAQYMRRMAASGVNLMLDEVPATDRAPLDSPDPSRQRSDETVAQYMRRRAASGVSMSLYD